MRNTLGGSSGSELRLENFARYEYKAKGASFDAPLISINKGLTCLFYLMSGKKYPFVISF